MTNKKPTTKSTATKPQAKKPVAKKAVAKKAVAKINDTPKTESVSVKIKIEPKKRSLWKRILRFGF